MSRLAVGQVVGFCHLPGEPSARLPSTRPTPLIHTLHQPRFHRIHLHVSHTFPQFSLRSDPVIVRLILPERPPTPQNPVRRIRRAPLDPMRNPAQLYVRSPNYVDVIGHDDPGMKVIQLLHVRAVDQSISDNLGDAGVVQPERAGATRNHLVQKFGLGRWRRAGQTPTHKEGGFFRYPVRQASVIKLHSEVVRGTPHFSLNNRAGQVAKTDHPPHKVLRSVVGQVVAFCHLPDKAPL